MNRTERQKQGIQKWLDVNGCGTAIYATGFGKTRVALMISQLLVSRDKNCKILVVVPTEVLKNQWNDLIVEWNLTNNCNVEIINTAIKNLQRADLLILDEAHLFASTTFMKIFQVVKYRFILCLTGTLERLDGKEVIIKKYAPVFDIITMEEAKENGWVSNGKEYLVELDVDLTEYNDLNNKFNSYFSYFNFDFNTAMKCVTDYKFRNQYAKSLRIPLNVITPIAMDWMRTLRKRKEFIVSHPKKFEVARKILNARSDKKCITFSATIKDAESIGIGLVLHSKQSKKKNAQILETFNNQSVGVLNSSKAADTGLDVKGLSVGIILSVDSSKIRKTQRIGRIVRFEEGKQAEMFTLVLRGTQDVTWFKNSATSSYIAIDEEQLEKVLNYEDLDVKPVEDNVTNLKYRF